MIDRIARDSLAERLRQLASGTISNFAFEERNARSSKDRSINAVESLLAWPCYDDFVEHRLEGGFQLTDGQKKDFARAVLFLKSDQEFQWPEKTLTTSLKAYFGRVFSYGAWMPKHAGGDLGVWPFWSREDYKSALKVPPYLKGESAAA